VTIGIPIWSPVDNRIVFIRTDRSAEDRSQTQWIINSDGSDRRPLAQGAASAAWSADGQWVYYQSLPPLHPRESQCIYKVHVSGNASPVRIRCDAAVPAPAPDGTLYFAPRAFRNANEIYKAKPENGGNAALVTRYAVSRVPLWPTGFALSPDARWIALPLKDRGTTNIWAVPTDGGPYRQITDFGGRAVLVARQVSWSKDGKFIFAAVAESEADIMLFDGMLVTRN
jgi:Tol biopolymer transport system component